MNEVAHSDRYTQGNVRLCSIWVQLARLSLLWPSAVQSRHTKLCIRSCRHNSGDLLPQDLAYGVLSAQHLCLILTLSTPFPS